MWILTGKLLTIHKKWKRENLCGSLSNNISNISLMAVKTGWCTESCHRKKPKPFSPLHAHSNCSGIIFSLMLIHNRFAEKMEMKPLPLLANETSWHPYWTYFLLNVQLTVKSNWYFICFFAFSLTEKPFMAKKEMQCST